MNAESIATYISNLEKDNAALKKLLQQCEEEKAILEYESMLHYAQVSDDESVASYTEESDDDFEPDEYTPLSDSESRLTPSPTLNMKLMMTTTSLSVTTLTW